VKRHEARTAHIHGVVQIGASGHSVACDLQKKRVRSKRVGRFQVDSQQIFGFIGVFLAAVVASYVEAAIDIGRRLKCVSFAQRDSVSKKEILMVVEFVVLA
jgi:hypothetical protein